MQAVPDSARRGINPWAIFVLICIPILIGAIDLTSIVVILPQATLDLLGPRGLNRAGQALWAVTAYLLAYTLSLALVGRLSDVLPRKTIFIVCIVLFIVGALWSGFATDLPMQLLAALPIWPEPDMLPLISLVIGRIIQAIGAGASVSVGMALVSDVFPPDRRAEPISLIGALDSLGWVIGNLFAGVMLQVLPSWRWLFLINAGVAVVALIFTVLALRGVRSVRTPNARYDWRGALLFGLALITLTIGIELLNHPTTEAYLLTSSSILFLIAFVWLQVRTKTNALFDMKLIRQREVSVALITNLLVGFALILVVAGVPLVINLRTLFLRGESLLIGALRAGIILCALTIPLLIAVLVGENRYRRVGAAIPVTVGLLLAAVGFLSTQFWEYTAPTPVIALPLALIGLGLGLTIGPLSLVVVDAAEESARGLASSLVLTMRLLGMTLGTPPAASLTLKWANEWADARIAPLSDTFRNIARPMLIPPMATDALIVVMMLGAAACGIGLLLFYLPRTIRAMRANRLGWQALTAGMPALLAGVLLVGVLSAVDAQVTPTVLADPIARQLPANVMFYAGFNIQQMFLRDTKRPLDGFESLIRTTVDELAAQSAAVTGQPGQQTPGQPPGRAETTSDIAIRLLFRPAQWDGKNYQPFCPYDVAAEEAEWCFGHALIGWIGPQAAFALLPRTGAAVDYVLAFQATNRNNAIAFATNLATAMGADEPKAIGPNIHTLSLNVGTADERMLAITDGYVLVGTPGAVQYTLNHGSVSLADVPDYRRITAQLPAGQFATFYVRSANFDAEVRPALNSFVQNAAVDSLWRVVNRTLPLFFVRTANTPTLVGLSMQVDEQRVAMNVVADFPFSLQRLNAEPVGADRLKQIQMTSLPMWVATRFNIAGIAREISVPGTLETLFRESNNAELNALLGNPITQRLVIGFGQALQTVLTHARGDALVLTLPAQDAAPGGMALVLPLFDREGFRAADALQTIRTQLQLAAVTGSVTVSDAQAANAQIVTISGAALTGIGSGALQYGLTSDNVLVVSTAGNIETLISALGGVGGSPEPGAAPFWSESTIHDRFLVSVVRPAMQSNPVDVLIGGAIRRQSLYLDITLQPR